MPPPVGRKQVKINHLTMAKGIAFVMKEPCTAPQLAAHIGIHLVTAWEWIRALRRESVIHISDWEEDSSGRRTLAVYKFGPGKDVVRPKLSSSEKAKRYRLRYGRRQDIQELIKAFSVAPTWKTQPTVPDGAEPASAQGAPEPMLMSEG